jgi:hypothetical protein
VRATPERDTSNAAGTDHALAAFRYARASSIAIGPSKSAASHQHRSPSSNGYSPTCASPVCAGLGSAACFGVRSSSRSNRAFSARNCVVKARSSASPATFAGWKSPST